jgi:hydrogenase maturation protease
MLVIGIGNDYRGDDAAGLEIARRIDREDRAGVEVRECKGDLVSLLDAWGEADYVVLIDAVQGDASPGTIVRFDARAERIPRVFASPVSSHGMDLADVIELAGTLQRLPARLIVYGVAGAAFEARSELSPEVEGALDEVVRRILLDIQNLMAV